ncbi:MAG: hypothetical protein Q4B22_01655 [Eubacteriales bacterium]|nr:hypothetical protein [Eubacteriales bacterium]
MRKKGIRKGIGFAAVLTAGILLGGICVSADVDSADMYRVYNPNSGEHFYTASAAERDRICRLGWEYEGFGWTAPASSEIPVYRLYNENAGDHHYTMNKGEKDGLVKLGWIDEGIGWYSDPDKTIPLYRQYNPNAQAGSHNYTTNKAENDMLVKIGWNEEGIAWHAMKDPDPTITNPITIRKGRDYASIYDFEEYLEMNPELAEKYAADDVGALQHFAEYGLAARKPGKKEYSKEEYDRIYDEVMLGQAKAKLAEIGSTLQSAYRYAAALPAGDGYGNAELSTRALAEYGFTNGEGGSYVRAAVLTEMASALGYEAYQMTGKITTNEGQTREHSWVEIVIDDVKYVFDPTFQNEERRNGYRIYYGMGGNWKYSDYSKMNG